ncbi:regulator of G protein signaling domain-containing protein [Lipomyces japonicus]|uniref:regulator of G protein signaling domain-containing protein n=1 Tax=Lipomyces japonicus TaxID=56871 RepID=UPI0034CE30C9
MLLQATRLLRFTKDNNQASRPVFDELTAVFATLISSLPLGSHYVGLFKVQHFYSFTSEEAILNLRELKLQQQIKTIDKSGKLVTSTTITTYVLEFSSCVHMMQLFLNARLLRCVTDPEKLEFKPNMLFQPTPKGVAIVGEFSQRIGVTSPNVRTLLTSSLNTCIRLVHLERDHDTDHISTIENVIEIIFQRFAGSQATDNSHNHASKFHNSPESHDTSDSTLSGPIDLSNYNDSYQGVRLVESKRFHLREFRNCFSGMSALQWIMNCTTVLDTREAITILKAFCQLGLITSCIERIVGDTFYADKNYWYILTTKGKHVAGWPSRGRSPNYAVSITHSELNNLSNFTIDQKYTTNLEYILNDPALRLLFKEHLKESICEENLVFYLESGKILEQFSELQKNQFPSLERVKICLSEAWMVYNNYLAPGSASEVNIDHSLRKRVRDRMTAEGNFNSEIEQSLSTAVNKVTEVVSLLVDVRTQVFRLMASDSVPKFIKTKRFAEVGLRELQTN